MPDNEIYTRSMQLFPSVNAETMDYLNRCIARGADIGSVDTFLHFQELRDRNWFGMVSTNYTHLKLDAWSPNQGTVDDFFEFFVRRLVDEPKDRWRTITGMYRDRVRNWCEPRRR